ncbi:uncharacterized protein ctdsp1 isoform X1 [Paramisgurnus dabryanus]|uniref:uncharacterized protein ctdsp1 isoform X1 n=1 Tax=Paramisgurnus dabryanus TaxID=90735 RepID=UPI0031F4592E
MPAELCFGPSEVSKQGDLKKQSQSLEEAAELCADFSDGETPIHTSVHQKEIGLDESDGLCYENSQMNGEYSDQHDQSSSSGYSSLLDSCSEHSESFEMSTVSVDLVEISQADEFNMPFDQSEISEKDAEQLFLSEINQDDSEDIQEDDTEQLHLPENDINICDCIQDEAEQLDLSEMNPDAYEYFQEDETERFNLSETNSDAYEYFQEDETEQLNLSETNSDVYGYLQDDDTEQLNLSEINSDVYEDLQEGDTEQLHLSEMNQDVYEYFQDDDEEPLNLSDMDPDQNEAVESFRLDLSDNETISGCNAEYEGSLSEEFSLSGQNIVAELNTHKECKPNDQNKPAEYHDIHFDSPDLCQVSKQSKLSDHCVSLEQTRVTGQMDTADDRATLHSPDCCTEETVDCSRTCCATEGTSQKRQLFKQECNQHFEQNESSEDRAACVATLEQCTSCGARFEKCDDREQCSSSMPTNRSESPHQSRLADLPTAQRSVFHSSELPKETQSNSSEVRKPSACDALFSGSMATFEARWLSQFLTDLLRHNQESADLEVSQSSEDFKTPESHACLEPEVRALENCGKLCKKCSDSEQGMKPQCFQLDSDGERTFVLHPNVPNSLDAETKGFSSDESSEEEYSDCIDSKSQGSSETDESFTSFADESESFEIFTDKVKHLSLTEDNDQSQDYPEDETTFDTYTQEALDVCEEAREIDSEEQDRKVTGQKSSKSYAEAVLVGLPFDPCQIHQSCADEVYETEAYEPNLIGENCCTLYSEEVKGIEPWHKNGELVEPLDGMLAQVSCVAAVEGYKHQTLLENSLEDLSTEFCYQKFTYHEDDTLELLDKEPTLGIEDSQDLNELNGFQNEEIRKDTVVENEETLTETEEAHGPFCGEIKTSEDEDGSLLDFEDVVVCAEEHDTSKENDDYQELFKDESKDSTAVLELSVSVGQQGSLVSQNESNDSSEVLHSHEVDLSEQSDRSEKLEQLIHQVAKNEASEHSEEDGFIKVSDQNTTSEQTDSSDDSEVSEDEEYSEFCECEFCVPPTDQVPAKPLLPQIKSKDVGKICVVIDLDETLVHSSFKPVNNADFIIPVEIDGTVHQVYVLKRPHVDEFLKRMGEMFECVLFTASLAKYADPVSDLLDKWGAFRSRLFRESCVFHRGNYVKDLSRLGRDLDKVIIVDNSPASYIFHPDNAVPVASWFDDMADTELLDLIPFFERLSKVDNVYTVLKQQRTTS